MSFGGPGLRQPRYKPKPPEKGSFPLDHDGECKSLVGEYLRCVRLSNGTNAPECRILAKNYLQCRMEHNLMAPEELRNLGFKEEDLKKSSAVKSGAKQS